jgi:hypothetical protein
MTSIKIHYIGGTVRRSIVDNNQFPIFIRLAQYAVDGVGQKATVVA